MVLQQRLLFQQRQDVFPPAVVLPQRINTASLQQLQFQEQRAGTGDDVIDLLGITDQLSVQQGLAIADKPQLPPLPGTNHQRGGQSPMRMNF